MLECARKVLDTADIVREAIFRGALPAAGCNTSSNELKLWFRHSEEGIHVIQAANYVQLRTRLTSVQLKHPRQAVHEGGRLPPESGAGSRAFRACDMPGLAPSGKKH
jgi:hypothetical protein